MPGTKNDEHPARPVRWEGHELHIHEAGAGEAGGDRGGEKAEEGAEVC